MTLVSGRKKRPVERGNGTLRDTRLIVIATEGAKTEKQYFEGISRHRYRIRRVQVRVEATADAKSAPEYALARLDAYCDEFQIGEDDELWLMVDVDRWGAKKLAAVAQKALQKGYHLAISNPCFELWLLLHFEEPSVALKTCAALTKRLKERLPGYRKSNLGTDAFTMEAIRNAVRRAGSVGNDEQARWPKTRGTQVYKVVEELLKERRDGF